MLNELEQALRTKYVKPSAEEMAERRSQAADAKTAYEDAVAHADEVREQLVQAENEVSRTRLAYNNSSLDIQETSWPSV